MSLKDRVRSLCKRKGVTAQQVEIELVLGKGYISKLDKSTPNAANLQKLADYFGVTYDYLLSESENPAPDIGFDDFTYAMQNESRELSPEAKDRLLQMARFFAEEERKKGR